MNRRLEQLEHVAQQRQDLLNSSLLSATLDQLGDGDLATLKGFFERLRRGCAFEEELKRCQPHECAAIERFNAAARIAGARL